MRSRDWFKKGLVDGIPISMGYLAVAFTLGIAAKNINMTWLQSFFMSFGMLASAGEYAAILLIGSGAGIIEMVTTTIVINMRYFLMSCSLSQKIKSDAPAWKRCLLAWFVTDELFGIAGLDFDVVRVALEGIDEACQEVVGIHAYLRNDDACVGEVRILCAEKDAIGITQ